MFASSEYQDDHAPLWSFVTIKEKIGDGGDLEGDVGKVVLEFEFKLRVSLCW